MATRLPPRELQSVLKSASVAATRRHRQDMDRVARRGETLVESGAVASSRRMTAALPSANAIRPVRAQPFEGCWFIHKPAHVPMTAVSITSSDPPPTIETVADYLRWSPVVRATFPNDELLSVPYAIGDTYSGVVTVAVGPPDPGKNSRRTPHVASLSSDIIVAQRFEALVWGHVQTTRTPQASTAPLASYISSATEEVSPAPSSVSSSSVPTTASSGRSDETDLAFVSVFHNGYLAGLPASLVGVTIRKPTLQWTHRIDWPLWVSAMLQPFTIDETPRQTDGGMERRAEEKIPRPIQLVGASHDAVAALHGVDAPRAMVNLASVVVLPTTRWASSGDAPQPFEVGSGFRFRQLLSDRPRLDRRSSNISLV